MEVTSRRNADGYNDVSTAVEALRRGGEERKKVEVKKEGRRKEGRKQRLSAAAAETCLVGKSGGKAVPAPLRTY